MHKESQRGGVNRIILILALVAVCAYIFFGTDVFNIKHIEVVGNSKVSAARSLVYPVSNWVKAYLQ